MFENRSFDNLLGRLYEPGDVASFEGVLGKGSVGIRCRTGRSTGALDDLVRDIVQTDTHLVVAALGGDAAAGRVALALAADYVMGREDIVLNPYYEHMGGLYGSEYWTYLLPRRVGPAITSRLTQAPFNPVGAREAVRIGLVDCTFRVQLEEFPRPHAALRRACRP